MPALVDLPLDVLLDSLFPCLDVTTLMRLSVASRAFRSTITGELAEPMWRQRLSDDLSFPANSSARTKGFYDLYRRASQSTTYTWGQYENGRLGIDQVRLRKLIARTGPMGGIPRPTPIHIDTTVVSIVAGGWSFHALDSKGQIWHWGQLDGERFIGQQAGDAYWLSPGATQREPRRLALALPRITSIDGGRSHLLALDEDRKIYLIHAWGLAQQVIDRDGRWRAGRSIDSISAGWNYSVVRLADKRSFIFWKPDEQHEADPAQSGVISNVAVDSLELPLLPAIDDGEEEFIAQIACGDAFLVARSETSRVYKLDISMPFNWPHDWPQRRERLGLAFRSGEIAWQYLPRFSDLASGARISHVQAHFRRFAALTPAAPHDRSAVLIGDAETTTETEPTIIPSLQGAGVVSLAFGDYHFGALDDRGGLRTWGSSSHGRLGLGFDGSLTGNVEVPTVVDIDSGFVFQAAFAGWHSSALVLRDADKPDPFVEDEATTEETAAEPTDLPRLPGAFPTRGGAPFAPPMRGLPNIRLGYPARGRGF